jgi:Autotransporter beta-domain
VFFQISASFGFGHSFSFSGSLATGGFTGGVDTINTLTLSGYLTASGSGTLTLVGTSATGSTPIVVSAAFCVPAATSSGPPFGSAKLHALQIAITPMVANSSGQLISNAINNGINDAFSPNGVLTTFGPNGGFISFANQEPRPNVAHRADEAFAAIAYAGYPGKAPDFHKSPLLLEREWSAWADVRFTGWKVDDTSGNANDIKGNQVNVTIGLGRRFTTDLLIGIVLGYENFKYDVAALTGSLRGGGETLGGYFAYRLGGNLRFDAALAWSKVDYRATADDATGVFTGSRWLVSSGLTGTYKYNVYMIEPSAKLYALWESEKAWTDSLGTAQPSRSFSAGRTALGMRIGRSFNAHDGWTIMPSVGSYGDWRFQSDSALPAGASFASIGTGWSGRITAGIAAKSRTGCTISFDGEYGGLGANYKIWTGSA